METPEEARQNRIDSLAELNKEHMLANSSELDSIVEDLKSDIARLISLHWRKPEQLGRLIKQLIEPEIDAEANLQAREKYFG